MEGYIFFVKTLPITNPDVECGNGCGEAIKGLEFVYFFPRNSSFQSVMTIFMITKLLQDVSIHQLLMFICEFCHTKTGFMTFIFIIPKGRLVYDLL